MIVQNKTKRKKRIKQTAEVFTPPKLVQKMLSKLPREVWKKGKEFLDPACGNGNFLVAVLYRKLNRGHNSLDALKCIFGTDIMPDNIQECRLRLLKVISLFDDITEEHVVAVHKNIICVNIKKHPLGSLEYDFRFSIKPKQENIDRWMKWVNNNVLEEIELPVDEWSNAPKHFHSLSCFKD